MVGGEGRSRVRGAVYVRSAAKMYKGCSRVEGAAAGAAKGASRVCIKGVHQGCASRVCSKGVQQWRSKGVQQGERPPA